MNKMFWAMATPGWTIGTLQVAALLRGAGKKDEELRRLAEKTAEKTVEEMTEALTVGVGCVDLDSGN